MMVTLLQAVERATAAPPPGVVPLNSARSSLDVVYVVGFMIVMVLLLGLVVLRLRKAMFAPEAPGANPGSVFEELRGMRKRGEITDAEFETMRRRAVEKLSAKSGPALSSSAGAKAEPIRQDQLLGKTGVAIDPTLRRARPGFDLTGEPLPSPESGD